LKVLIVYDSFFGNTLKVGEMFQKEFINRNHEVELVHVAKADLSVFDNHDLFLVGSPTRGFRATQPIKMLLKDKEINFESKPLFLFDTRIDPVDIKSRMLKKLIGTFGYAVDHMVKLLNKRKAGRIIGTKGYPVITSEGPLKPEVAYQVEMDVKDICNKLSS